MAKLTMLGGRLATAPTTTVKMHVPQTWEDSNNSSKYYDRHWRRARLEHLMLHPLCVHCLAKGIINADNLQVDHIIPHRGDMILFWDRTNWATLCLTCHSRKTVAENAGAW